MDPSQPQLYRHIHGVTKMGYISSVYIIVMEWSGRRTGSGDRSGRRTGSGHSQNLRPQQAEAAIRIYCTADNFQHTQNDHSHA